MKDETHTVMNRVKTGITGLDDIIGGGYPEGTNILVTGPSGTGKTTFCFQYLYSGLQDYDENGIYVTLEERPEDLRSEMSSLGWNAREFENEKRLVIIDAASARYGLPTKREYTLPTRFDVDSLLIYIHRVSQQINAKRLVIDSLSSLELQVNSTNHVRRTIYRLSSLLLKTGLTSLLTSESIGYPRISRYGIEEFICRGVIILDLEENGNDLKRTIRVLKMRGIKHTLRKLPFEIQENGITIFAH